MDILTIVSLLLGIIVSIGSIIGVIFKFVIIQPLETAIKQLSELVVSIQDDIKDSREDRRKIATEVEALKSEVKIEIKNIWKRIDDMK